MPLDHYVSQVHLKNFYSPALDNLMFAMRKSDLKEFQCRSQDVCRIEEGSTNKYLTEPREVEDFLENVEPKYNAAVSNFRKGNYDVESIHALSGFIAYITCCSPTALRINIVPLETMLVETAKVLDAQGIIEKAPEALGNKTMTELLKEGTVKFDVDPKYPQAVGISNIIERVSIYGNAHWEILFNNTDSPYLTSDFPAAIEPLVDEANMRRIVPLAPDIAVRITPDIKMRGKTDLKFGNFSAIRTSANRHEVVELNRTIVQCAEETVFFRDNHAWIPNLIKRNQDFRIDSVVRMIPHGNKSLPVPSQRIMHSKK